MGTPRLFDAVALVFGLLAEYRAPGSSIGREVRGIFLSGTTDPDLGLRRTRLTERRFVVSSADGATIAKGGTLIVGSDLYTIADDPQHRGLDEYELALRVAA